MELYSFKKLFFKNTFLPKWIGIDACFCFCAALLAGQPKNKDNRINGFSAIDLSSRQDAYPVPTDDQLRSDDKPFISEVDQLVIGLLKSGVRVRARDEFHQIDHHGSLSRIIGDSRELSSEQHWDSNQIIDYQDRQLVFHDDPKGLLRQSLVDYDYHMQTGGDYELIREILSAIIDIEVYREDLLDSLLPLVDEYSGEDTSDSINKSITLATSKNRLFFSTAVNKWIVEFNGTVGLYKNPANSVQFTNLLYILSNPLTSTGTTYKNSYHYVVSNGTGLTIEDTDNEQGYSDDHSSGGGSISDFEDNERERNLNNDTIASTIELRDKTTDTKRSQHYQDKIDVLTARNCVITHNGHTTSRRAYNINNRVKQSIRNVLIALDSNPDFKDHIKENIIYTPEYVYYEADIVWITTEDSRFNYTVKQQ